MLVFEVDDKMNETLTYLKVSLNAESKEAILRKAIALLALAVKHKSNDNCIIINGCDEDIKVIL